jgi:hypothetical protein
MIVLNVLIGVVAQIVFARRAKPDVAIQLGFHSRGY